MLNRTTCKTGRKYTKSFCFAKYNFKKKIFFQKNLGLYSLKPLQNYQYFLNKAALSSIFMQKIPDCAPFYHYKWSHCCHYLTIQPQTYRLQQISIIFLCIARLATTGFYYFCRSLFLKQKNYP